MQKLKTTIEVRCYSEEEAKDFLEDFRQGARQEGYTVGANGYTYKSKKAKGEIVDEAWICKCTKIHDEVWD